MKDGSVVPTHCNVIHDTAHLSPAAVQCLTYGLCHMHFNLIISTFQYKFSFRSLKLLKIKSLLFETLYEYLWKFKFRESRYKIKETFLFFQLKGIVGEKLQKSKCRIDCKELTCSLMQFIKYEKLTYTGKAAASGTIHIPPRMWSLFFLQVFNSKILQWTIT